MLLKKLSEIKDSVEKSILEINNALKHGNKVLVAGNGGSAADANHLTAEQVWKFENSRRKPYHLFRLLQIFQQ